jgi:hypothetical protein
MTSRPLWLSAAALVAIGVVGFSACFPVTKGAPCSSDENCPTGQHCVAGFCDYGSGTDGGAGGGTGMDGGVGGGSGGGTGGGAGGGSGGGSGGGTGGSDGGEVDAGPVDAGVGEASFGANACFDGADNDSDGMTDCADSDCNGAACRATAGDCDKAESCFNGTCPADTLRTATEVCRGAAGDCDLEELCSGVDAGCPADVMLGTGAECRAAMGPCDIAERCTGGSACPPDVLEPATKVCGAGNDECDLEEKCTGVDAGCPADALQPNTHPCRPAVGGCDTAELCTGLKTCPADVNSCPANQFCGGAACVAKRANGAACTATVQCTSGNCVDGFCCDGACAGQCDACDLVGSLGTCRASPTTVSCRAAVNTCDAEEKCDGTNAACPPNGFASTTTTCAAASCTGGNFTPQATCDGSGVCSPPSTVSCGFYLCNGPACFTSCTTDAQCTATSYCTGGAGGLCKPKGANGVTCGAGNQCTSGNCIDGVCCDGACNGRCEACNLAASPGQCKPSAANTDPDNDCGAYTCDGAGVCRTSCGSQPACTMVCKGSFFCQGGVCAPDKASGTCGSACECTSGNCADGFCCNTACVGPCQACNITGQEGSCRPQPAGNDPENGCGAYNCDGAGACNASCAPTLSCPSTCKAGAYCTAAGCGPDQTNGASCTAGCQCTSGVCNGYYKDSDLDGYGAGPAVMFCGATPPTGYSSVGTDCNDGNVAFNPGVAEIPGDEIDQNCDGTERCFIDADGDGYRLTTTVASPDVTCGAFGEATAAKPTGDCCDTDGNARPGQTTYYTAQRAGCGGWDYNCSGGADTLQYPSLAAFPICSGGPPFCTQGFAGWNAAPIPSCGQVRSDFRDCSATCGVQSYTVAQGCR